MIPEFFISTHKCSNTCSVWEHNLSPQHQLLEFNSNTQFPKDHLQEQILIHWNKYVAMSGDTVSLSLQLWEFFRVIMVSSTHTGTHRNCPVWPQCWHELFQFCNSGSKGPCGFVWHTSHITWARTEALFYMTLGHEGRPHFKRETVKHKASRRASAVLKQAEAEVSVDRKQARAHG